MHMDALQTEQIEEKIGCTVALPNQNWSRRASTTYSPIILLVFYTVHVLQVNSRAASRIYNVRIRPLRFWIRIRALREMWIKIPPLRKMGNRPFRKYSRKCGPGS